MDIIVLGDSLGMTSISPMAWWGDYGMTGYVCGQTGQRMQEAFHMLQAAYETPEPQACYSGDEYGVPVQKFVIRSKRLPG